MNDAERVTQAQVAAGIPLTNDPHLAWYMDHEQAMETADEVRANRHCTAELVPAQNGMWLVMVSTPADGKWWAL